MISIKRLSYVAFSLAFGVVLITADGQRRGGIRRISKAQKGNQQRQSGRSYKENINGLTLEMVLIPSGTFMMGASGEEVEKVSKDLVEAFATAQRNFDDEKKWLTFELPKHRVSVPNFYIGRYEVTQAQYRAVMGKNPSFFQGDDLPVESLSWNDAVEFCQRLSKITGKEYRLPSEAQWEYASRAGTTGTYVGNLESVAWYGFNSGGKRLDPLEILRTDRRPFTERYDNQTHPIGTKQPNAFGLYDMIGNVWEMCQDLFHESYQGSPTDGSAWISGENRIKDLNKRIIRGGSWVNINTSCRYTERFPFPQGMTNSAIGFRVIAVVRK